MDRSSIESYKYASNEIDTLQKIFQTMCGDEASLPSRQIFW